MPEFDAEISKIKVPPDRQRKTISTEGINSLAVSMQTKGQLHPIIVIREPDGWLSLVTGGRRLKAAQILGWITIRAIDKSGLSKLQLKEIELEENLEREDLHYVEECQAKAEIWSIRQQLYGDTVEEVAEHFGQSRGAFWEDARLAKAIEVMPELGKKKNKTQAQNALRLFQRRLALEELAKRGAPPSLEGENYSPRVHLGNCLTVMKEWENETVHCIITDPPYGIELDEGETKKSNPHPVIYQDAHYDIMEVIALAAKECFRLLVRDAHAYFFFDIKAYSKVFQILTNVGFSVDPVPLAWIKNIAGQTNHPDSRFGSSWEACFFCRKGNRALLKQGQSNALIYDVVPSGRKIHPTEKPSALIRQLIEISTVSNEVILDPFGGSGSTAEAAIQTGRNFIIIENDLAYHMGILNRLAKVTAAEANEEQREGWEEELKAEFDVL